MLTASLVLLLPVPVIGWGLYQGTRKGSPLFYSAMAGLLSGLMQFVLVALIPSIGDAANFTVIAWLPRLFPVGQIGGIWGLAVLGPLLMALSALITGVLAGLSWQAIRSLRRNPAARPGDTAEPPLSDQAAGEG